MDMNITSLAELLNKGVSNYNEIKKYFHKSPKALEEISKKNSVEKRKKTSIDTNPQKLIDNISSKSTTSLKDWLLTIKEVDIFYEKTHIPPQYIFYIVSVILTIIIINYFSKTFTLIVGVIYPVHCSIRVMANYDWYDNNCKKRKFKKEEEKKRKINLKKMQNWLEYWIVFFLFYNIETFFGSFLQKIPMYLFYKVVFLAILFLPWYKGAHYIYRSHLREAFRVYESILYSFSLNFFEKIKEEIFIDKPKENKNMSSDEEEPMDSSSDKSGSWDNDEDENNEKAKNIKTFVSKNKNNKYFKK
jgi:hypothetical protein